MDRYLAANVSCNLFNWTVHNKIVFLNSGMHGPTEMRYRCI